MLLPGIIEPEHLFHKLLDAIRGEGLDPLGARKWTRAVKNSLRAMARDIDPEIDCCPNETTGEFLLDFIWFKRARSQDPFANGQILLAVECEWGGPNAAWEDFSKLLYIKSPRKLLICSLTQPRWSKQLNGSSEI